MSIAMVFIEVIIAVSLCFYTSLAKRVGYADQGHAACLPKADATRPETSFSYWQEIQHDYRTLIGVGSGKNDVITSSESGTKEEKNA